MYTQAQKPRTLMKLLGLFMAAFIIAGCSSTGSGSDPIPEQEEVIEEVAPTPIQETQERSDFDGLNPLDANGNLLSRTFYFGYDKAVLSASDLAGLELHAQVLRRNPDRSVVIEGHCDERGTREYNLALGERRADTVRNFLLSAGVSSRQLETVSYGEEQPEDPGHNESSWARNRNAVMSYR